MSYCRSISYLVNRFIFKKAFLVAKARPQSLKLRFKTEDGVGRSIYKKGTYEPEITSYFLNNLDLGKDDIVLDVGANIGWYSLLLASKFGATVYAFEPDALNFSLLKENIKLNDLSNILPVNKALSNKSGDAYLYRYKDSNLGRHSLLPINTEGRKEKVECITLDSFVQNEKMDIDKIKLIKMDIEGYEYQALQGALSLLAKVPVILTEYSPALMSANNLSVADYLALFQENGYQPYEISEQGFSAVTFDWLSGLGDCVVNIVWKR